MSDIFHTVLHRLAASVGGLLHNVVMIHWSNRWLQNLVRNKNWKLSKKQEL